jgi:formamidopyrimidine-DNA glycosylase
MPELPEVETVRRSLELHLVGQVVRAVHAQPVALRRPLEPALLTAALTKQSVLSARRRGKYLLADLGSGDRLFVHLGMTGRLTVCSPEAALAPHTHLRLGLENGRELRFIDPRRFGFVTILDRGAEDRDPSLARLGMEPLSPAFPDRLPQLVRPRSAPVKSLLLDQSLVAGVGNIYAAESLWRAGIHPARKGRCISVPRLEALGRHLQAVLGEAIEMGGTTVRDFATPEGGSGYFAIQLAVYGRAGQGCQRCGAKLKSRPIGGRATVWCGRCQR